MFAKKIVYYYIDGIAKELFLSHLVNNKLALKVLSLCLKTHVANKIISSNQLHSLTWFTGIEMTPRYGGALDVG